MVLEITKLTAFNENNPLDYIYSKYYSFFNSKSINLNLILGKDFNIVNNEIEDIFELFSNTGKDIENLFSSSVIKKNGKYCTNSIEIVDLIINSTIDFSDILNKRILEPSCGYGIFLLRILYFLKENNYSQSEIVDFINNNLVGFDLSPTMVHFSILNIKLYVSYLYGDIKLFHTVKPRIYLSDTTYKPQNSTLNLFESMLNFVESEEAKLIKLKAFNGELQFDYIIGNPPYVTLYGRRDNKKSESLREYYIKNYDFIPKYVKNGKFNILMFFFEQSLHWLKEGSLMSFIIDISIYETAYCFLRKYLLENTKIISLITDVKAFDVASGQVIIVLQKSSNLESNKANLVKVVNYDTNTSLELNQSIWLNEKNEYKFEIIDDKTNNILKKIEEKSKQLDYFYGGKKLRTCCMVLDMENIFTSDMPSSSYPSLPYYEGSKSLKTKYSKFSFNKYFIFNKALQDKVNDKLKEELTLQGIKNKKRVGFGDLSFYNSYKLFIRQSAKEIISSLSIDPACANNSLYCLSDGESTEESLKKLKITCTQLNSKLLTFYALAKRIIRVCNGKQPQIKIGDLKRIPLSLDSKFSKELLCLYDEYEKTRNEIFLNKIDSVIYSYYNLESEDIKFIESLISTL